MEGSVAISILLSVLGAGAVWVLIFRKEEQNMLKEWNI